MKQRFTARHQKLTNLLNTSVTNLASYIAHHYNDGMIGGAHYKPPCSTSSCTLCSCSRLLPSGLQCKHLAMYQNRSGTGSGTLRHDYKVSICSVSLFSLYLTYLHCHYAWIDRQTKLYLYVLYFLLWIKYYAFKCKAGPDDDLKLNSKSVLKS